MSNDDDVLLAVAAIGAIAGAFYLWMRQNQTAAMPYQDDTLPIMMYDPSSDFPSSVDITPGFFTDYAPTSSSTAFFPSEQPMSNSASASSYTTSINGQNHVLRSEGKRNDVYPDGAGYLTVGVGHKVLPSDHLKLGDVILDSRVFSLFADDLSTAENGVKSYVTAPITQGQFDALVDMFFNFGSEKMRTSTLLRALNMRDYSAASAEFAKWIHGGNPPVVMDGLVTRRNADIAMFDA